MTFEKKFELQSQQYSRIFGVIFGLNWDLYNVKNEKKRDFCQLLTFFYYVNFEKVEDKFYKIYQK